MLIPNIDNCSLPTLGCNVANFENPLNESLGPSRDVRNHVSSHKCLWLNIYLRPHDVSALGVRCILVYSIFKIINLWLHDGEVDTWMVNKNKEARMDSNLDRTLNQNCNKRFSFVNLIGKHCTQGRQIESKTSGIISTRFWEM